MSISNGNRLEWAYRAVSVDHYGALGDHPKIQELGRCDKDIYEKAEKGLALIHKMGYDISTTRHTSESKRSGNEPKSDLLIDGMGVSIKMPGVIQLSSAEGGTTSRQINLVLDEMESEGMSVDRFRETSAIIKNTPTKMIDGTKQLNIDKVRSRKPKIYEQMVANGKVRPEYDASLWDAHNKQELKERICELFDNRTFQNKFVEELLTGKRIYENDNSKIATHISTPEGFDEINQKYIEKIATKVKPDVRKKSRAGVSSVTFRFDLKL